MKILATLRKFDGRHTEPLRALANSPKTDDTTLAELVAISEHDDVKMQVAATWILKQWVDAGVVLSASTIKTLFEALTAATHWEVRLHLLQMFSTSSLRLPNSKKVQQTLISLIQDENKLVRAWAYSALAQLADFHSKLRKQVQAHIAVADQNEAASVCARVRKIRKKYPWAS